MDEYLRVTEDFAVHMLLGPVWKHHEIWGVVNSINEYLEIYFYIENMDDLMTESPWNNGIGILRGLNFTLWLWNLFLFWRQSANGRVGKSDERGHTTWDEANHDLAIALCLKNYDYVSVVMNCFQFGNCLPAAAPTD